MAKSADTTSPSRRAMLSGLPLGAAMFPFAVATAGAAEVGPSEIEIAFREYLRLGKIAAAAYEKDYEARKRCVFPEHPRHKLGFHEGNMLMGPTGPSGRRPALLDNSEQNIDELRDMIAVYSASEFSWEQRQAKQAEITIAEIETYNTECERRREQSGLNAAVAKREVASAAEDAQRDLIYAMPAFTFKDLAFKAVIASHYDWDETKASELLERFVDMVGIERADFYSN